VFIRLPAGRRCDQSEMDQPVSHWSTQECIKEHAISFNKQIIKLCLVASDNIRNLSIFILFLLLTTRNGLTLQQQQYTLQQLMIPISQLVNQKWLLLFNQIKFF